MLNPRVGPQAASFLKRPDRAKVGQSTDSQGPDIAHAHCADVRWQRTTRHGAALQTYGCSTLPNHAHQELAREAGSPQLAVSRFPGLHSMWRTPTQETGKTGHLQSRSKPNSMRAMQHCKPKEETAPTQAKGPALFGLRRFDGSRVPAAPGAINMSSTIQHSSKDGCAN